MKKLITFVFSVLLGVIFLVGLFKYAVSWEELQEELARVQPLQMIVIVVFVFISMLLATLTWREILKAFGFSFSVSELFPARTAAFSICYLIPIGVFWADILRARVIGKKENKSGRAGFSVSLASVLVDRIFNIIVSLFFGSVGLFLFFRQAGTLWLSLKHIYLTSILFSLFILFLLLFFIVFPSFFKRLGFLNFLFNSFSHEKTRVKEIKKETISFFKKLNPSSCFKISLFALLHGLSLLFLTYLIISSLGYKLSFVSSWALFGPVLVSLETPISADLGSHDITSAFVCEALGMKRSTGVVYAFIFRGAHLILTTAGLIFLFKIGINALKDHLISRLT